MALLWIKKKPTLLIYIIFPRTPSLGLKEDHGSAQWAPARLPRPATPPVVGINQLFFPRDGKANKGQTKNLHNAKLARHFMLVYHLCRSEALLDMLIYVGLLIQDQ